MWEVGAQVVSLSDSLSALFFVVFISTTPMALNPPTVFHLSFLLLAFANGCSVSPFLTPSFLTSHPPFLSLPFFCVAPYLF